MHSLNRTPCARIVSDGAVEDDHNHEGDDLVVVALVDDDHDDDHDDGDDGYCNDGVVGRRDVGGCSDHGDLAED